jgi:hypothetical protein
MALTFPSHYNKFACGINVIADVCHIDIRFAAVLFFALLWGICRVGNARVFKCKFVNGLLFIISAVVIELLLAFVICVVVLFAKFDGIIQT